MYTISAASAMSGVPVATIRAWERRYSVVEPNRTDSGYRLYDDTAIAVLTRMRDLVNAGVRPQQAADQARESVVRALPAPALGRDDDDDNATGALIAAAAALDPTAVEQVLDEQLGRASFEATVDGWLMPALVTLGLAWQQGRVTVAGEHLVATAVHRRLSASFNAAGSNQGGRRVLVGLLPGAQHELGLLAFATAARRTGMSVSYLGPNLPIEDWIEAARSDQVAAVVLTLSDESSSSRLATLESELRQLRPDLLVAVGGLRQDLAPADALQLGHRVGPAARILRDAIVSRGRKGGAGRSA
ncbi:cobalamin B12-binding domain-containing protein [Luteipulveratus sp. YIM 133132]|uniref:Cobalamin B12-binding domain-containing protein n=1 Tax=Luteipulveratus flavus TaxID=3031728 RepID=A0ABT6C3J6_9MICO|nr:MULTISPECIES: cobalamin B12-binding domain-containing protein [unclassified Luteipulveratus]MDE9366402.1 cobalamin B12-binding domain-containing protein [Luteipulveratus sp. YIM 133132]MDF8263226.1 cobalamin B12-binding domain-containing protein [Luteipulveratus sp. YIM 133296]